MIRKQTELTLGVSLFWFAIALTLGTLSLALISSCARLPEVEQQTKLETCRAFVSYLGEPDAPCYCPADSSYCTIRLKNYLIRAKCSFGRCDIQSMEGDG